VATPAGTKRLATLESLLTSVDLDGLLSLLESHRTRYAELAKCIGRSAVAVRGAADIVDESFSGSCFGWHAELYYGNFERPPWGEQFDVEFGGLYGISHGWRQRTKMEVEKRVEELSNQSLEELGRQRWLLARAMREVHDDFLASLAPLANVSGMAKEKEFLQKLDAYKWDDSAFDEFAVASKKRAPSATRDSGAAMQGFKLPAHVACAGLAYCGEKFAVSAEDFWELGIRLIKHLKAHAAIGAQVFSTSNEPLEVVLNICRQFHIVAIEMHSRHNNRPALTISDEYDVQDLLRALLRQQFNDVREEETAPSSVGRAPRMDFLLKSERIVVETKMTRDALKDREIGDELLQDIGRYKDHPDCSTLVCFIYDPKGLLKNPTGLGSDLERQSDGRLTIKAVLCPSRA
jgi:hypothetical protein